jgi:hypothetical protein
MKLRTLFAAMAFAFAPLALHAQTTATGGDIDKQAQLLNATAENKGQAQVAAKIASNFANLAGSQENSLSLVQALRTGSKVTLTTNATGSGTGTGTGTGTATTTSFTPPTGKMGWGNVFNSLALAQSQLRQLGITNPTNAQLQAALVGGDVTVDGKTTTMKGILTMRADGMGWGQIAHATGTKLGPVVSSIKSTQNKVAALAPATAGATGTATTTTAGNATVKSSAKGMVTAGGTSAGSVTHGNSANAPGRGMVTAAGGSAAATVTHGNSANASSRGAGMVNAGGGSAAGVTSALGNAGGNGNGNGKGNGKGKGGG